MAEPRRPGSRRQTPRRPPLRRRAGRSEDRPAAASAQEPEPASGSARSAALRALVQLEAGGRANVEVPRLLATSGLAERDRAFVTELVYGTMRMQRACDWLVDRHLRKPVQPDVRAALRVGAYQLALLGTPAHAAVSATVAEVRGPARGLVNAVLRRVAEDVAAGRRSWPSLAVELSYPDWVVERLSVDLGAGAAVAALRTMNLPARVSRRADGYIQDLSSQAVAAAIGASSGEMILDLCAAPGGKTTAMAYGAGGPVRAVAPRNAPAGTDQEAGADGQRVSEEGQEAGVDGQRVSEDDKHGSGDVDAGRGRPALVVGADIDPGRAAVIAANARQLSLSNVGTVVADGRRPPWPAGSFDRVLVDAPCSGLGVLRRRPDARWRVKPADVPRLASLQRELLGTAAGLVRPGGVLAYSVCTLTKAETAGIDRWLATEHPELVPLPPPGDPWARAGRGALLLPQAEGGDGMFLLLLRRRR